jgi:hypothetical protein
MREQIVWETVEMLFYQSKIHYLGHVISNEGIIVDPMKVEAIMEYPASMNVPEVHSFMVLARYYRWFVEGFWKIANPSMKMKKKNQKLYGPRVHRIISKAQGEVDDNVDTKNP